MEVYPAPNWLKEESPTAEQVFSTERDAAGAAAHGAPAPDAAKPIVMPCPQCGGALRVAGDTERTVTCQYCATDVYLLDEPWHRLHPVRIVREWFVRFDGETRAQRFARRDAEAHRRLPSVRLGRWVGRRTALVVAVVAATFLIAAVVLLGSK